MRSSSTFPALVAPNRLLCFNRPALVLAVAWALGLSPAMTAAAADASPSAEKTGKALRARDVFNYHTPVLFRDNFSGGDFDRWNISQNDRYRLTAADPEWLRIVPAGDPAASRTAARFTVVRAPNSFRSELSLPHEAGYQERWYGLRLMLSDDWVADDSNGADIVIQWHAIPGNWRATHPNLAILVDGNRWRIRQVFGSPQSSPTRTSVLLEAPIKPGAWVSWVIHARWSSGDDGVLNIWQDGKLVLEHRGINVYNTIGVEYTPYLKTGIYHPEWYLTDERRRAAFAQANGSATKRVTYVTDVTVGDARASFDVVAPR